ncbi:hypothetical protein IAT38_007357 [Cryptococcus sp. DSM 104549]
MSFGHSQSIRSSPSIPSPLPGYGPDARWELTSPSSAVITVKPLSTHINDTAASSATCRGTAANELLAWNLTPEQLADELQYANVRNGTEYWLKSQQLSTHRQPTALTATTVNADGSKGPTYTGNLTVQDDFKLGDMLDPLVVACMVGVDALKDVTELQYECTPDSQMLFSIDRATFSRVPQGYIGVADNPATIVVDGKTKKGDGSAKFKLLIDDTNVSSGADREAILDQLRSTWATGEWTTPATGRFSAELNELQ